MNQLNNLYSRYFFGAVCCAITACGSNAGDGIRNRSIFRRGLTWVLDDSGCLTISSEGEIPDYADLTTSPRYDVRNDVTEIVISEGITRIGNFSLFDMGNVSSVSLPQTLISIDNQGMAYMHSLTTLQIPSSVTTLDAACFGNCTQLITLYVYNPAAAFVFLPYGYRYDSTVDDYVAIPNVTLYGHADSTVESYAQEHSNIEFIPLSSGTISGSSVMTEVMERTDSRDLIHIYTEEDLEKSPWIILPVFGR